MSVDEREYNNIRATKKLRSTTQDGDFTQTGDMGHNNEIVDDETNSIYGEYRRQQLTPLEIDSADSIEQWQVVDDRMDTVSSGM